MNKTNIYLTVGELLEQLKDTPKDYVVLIATCEGNSYGGSIDIDDKDKEVAIIEYC